MTTHYSDQAGFVSDETEGKANGMAGSEAFKGEVTGKAAASIRLNGHEPVGPSTRKHEAQLELTPGLPIVHALRKLARAFQYAIDCDRSKWDFAVEISDMDSLGISHDELRWMIGKGLAEQAREVSDGSGIGRAFDSPGGFTLSPQSCFVVTATGLQMANDLTTEIGNEFPALAIGESSEVGSNQSPVWDNQRRELRLAGELVKRFKWRAVNQEAILAAFQEEGWPARIDDPLSPIPDTDPKRRLSDTIKCLNRKQQNPRIRFIGDGTGEGVLWDLTGSDD